MSSIIISGDTSGSITVAAPAVSGTNTATLPASTGTIMVSGNMPAFSAYQSSATSIANSTGTKILFGNENFDTNNNFSSSTFTPTVAGYYQVIGKIAFSPNATNSRWTALYKNGTKIADIGWALGNGTNFSEAVGSYLIYMNGTTDYLEIYGFQNSGSTLTTDGGVATYFQASMVRAA
jgi:hypothetical protein